MCSAPGTMPTTADPTPALDEPTSRHQRRSRLRRATVITADALALMGGVFVAGRLTDAVLPAAVAAGYVLAVWAWMVALRLYNSRLVTHRREELGRIGTAAVRGLLVAGALAWAFRVEFWVSTGLAMITATMIAVGLERELLRHWFARHRKAGTGLWPSILIANPADGAQLRVAIDADSSSPHTIVGELDPTDIADAEELLTRSLELARSVDARGAVVVEASLWSDAANRLVRGLLEAGFYVDLASMLSDIATDRLATRNLGPTVATWIAPRPRGGWRAGAKRAFDLAVTSLVLVAAAPIMIVVALLVRVTSPGPVLFRQERVGRNGEPFDMLKFRSMVVNAEELLAELDQANEGAGPLFKMKTDPRVTPVGRLLRKTSLDELPQLFNVLRNDMSLVGPRPALRAEMAEWDPALYARLQVQPGITGMWQVSGRSATSFAEYTRLDLYYVHNWSLLVDLSILAKTVPAVLRSDGAF